MIQDFKTASFQQEVLDSGLPVLVDFWAPWCSHCIALEPVLEDFASSEAAKNIRIGRVNIDEEPELARQYRIMSIPSVLFFRDGMLAGKKTAPQDSAELEKLIK